MLTSKPKNRAVSGDSGDSIHLFREGRIDFPLYSLGHKLLVILVFGIPSAMIAFKTFQTAEAARLGSRLNAQSLQQAIVLDSDDAAYYHKLGLVYAYSFNNFELHDVLKYLQKAAKLNPRKALYWSDLAEACDALNDTACSNPAVERALTLSPMTPRFEWRAGNHDLQTGHVVEALERFRRLLALDGTYAQPVFRVCLGVVGNPETVFQKVLPSGARPQLELAYLDFISAQGDIDFANKVWNQISSEHLSCSFADIKPYLSHLLRADDIQQATKVWDSLEAAGVIPKPAGGRGKNLVYNNGFEHDPLGAGFGWHVSNTPYVETDFHDPSAYQGSRCLRVDYARGENSESEPVYELVPVKPHQTYRLRAYVRSDGITSHSGPRLRVLDPHCPACLNTSTKGTVGSTPWHRLSLNFTTGSKTRAIQLSVWRPRCWTFPMEISGSFWLDDVSLSAVNTKAKGTVSAR